MKSAQNMAGALPFERKHSLGLRVAKRTVDIFVALSFFAVFGWLFVLVWLGVRLTSRGPVIYSQKRFGRAGKVFRVYKFRSMVRDAQEVLAEHLRQDADAQKQWTDFQKLKEDPRVTKFGAFIRKSSLDELPQIWNVLVGDMSLVGPRPCMLDQRELYGQYWPYYSSVRPGITGLWQVSGRNKLSFSKRVALDVDYVCGLSPSLDLYIFFKTPWVVLTGHGSH